MGLAFDIGIACLAVLGFYCLICTVLGICFPSDRLRIAVEIRNEKDADMLDVLLHEAESAFFRKRGMRVTVLISQALFDAELIGSVNGTLYDRYARILDYYGAECYMIDFGDE